MQGNLSRILGEVEDQGYSVIPNVLDATELATLRDALDAAIEESKRRGIDVFDARLDPNAHNVRVNNLPEMHPAFIEILRHPLALKITRALLGETAIVSNFSANIAFPGAASMNIHSDQSLIAPPPWNEGWVLNIIWCLDDVRPENGGTMYIPGSHRFRELEDVPENPESQMRAFSAPAGSIIVMEGRVWHTSGINTTKDERRALLFAFYGRSYVRQMLNWEALLSDATKMNLDEDARTLLGMGALNNSYGISRLIRPGNTMETAKVL